MTRAMTPYPYFHRLQPLLHSPPPIPSTDPNSSNPLPSKMLPDSRLILLYRSISSKCTLWAFAAPASQSGPFSINLNRFFHCHKRVKCYSMVADLNWSISPSGFMNWAAFWRISGWLAFLPNLSYRMLLFLYLLLVSYPFPSV